MSVIKESENPLSEILLKTKRTVVEAIKNTKYLNYSISQVVQGIISKINKNIVYVVRYTIIEGI